MGLLLPGYEKLAEDELVRQAAIHRVDRLPYSSSFAATKIHVIDSQESAEAWASQLLTMPVSMLGVDCEFTFDGPEITLRNGKHFVDPTTIRPLVCSVAAYCGAQTNPDPAAPLVRLLFDLRRPEVLPSLQTVLRLHVPWVAHSAKAELHCLWACGLELEEQLVIDTWGTACCLNLGRFHKRKRKNGSPNAAAEARAMEAKAAHITSLVGQCAHYGLNYPFTHLKVEMRARFMSLGDTGVIDPVMVDYAMSDAEYALRLYFAQRADVDRFGLGPHLAKIEWPLVPVIARMESNGLPVDADCLDRYRTLCRGLAGQMAQRLEPHGIIPGSPNSFLVAMKRAGLLEHFQIDGKVSTAQDILRRCEKLHPAITPFRLHRYFQKLTDDELLAGRLTCQDGRLHCKLDQLRSVTGRIATSKPNLIGLDKRLHPIVAAPPGMVLIELDYSQIEVGLAGAEWQDDNLVRLFNSGDAYAAIAQSFYRGELMPEELDLSSQEFKRARPDLRGRVKALVLGVLYGRAAVSIAISFGCSLEHAQEELQRFFDHFPNARDNAAQAVKSARARGYGVSATGLHRFIPPGMDQMDNAMRNHPIQSIAASIFKAALLRVHVFLRGTSVQMLLPRHDSILLLIPVELEKEIVDAVTIIMVGAVREIYPQLMPGVGVESGQTWPTETTLDAYYARELDETSDGLKPVRGRHFPGQLKEHLDSPPSSDY